MSDGLRLSVDTLALFPPDEAERFAYDRDAQAAGIIHFGIGAFHRAHQAWYTDAAMNAGDQGWMITGVSLRSAEVAEQMNPQQGLYTVTERSAQGASSRVIGAVREVLVAPYETEAVIAALAAPATHIASLTITEKGYCRAADGGLDPELAGEVSVYRYLAAGLRRRQISGLPGLTLLCCDNLAQNGAQLARLMGEYLDRHDPALQLLQMVRDETHRFAVSSHRRRRSKRTLHSALDELDGIGDKRRKLLIEHFGSLSAVKQASQQDLANLLGRKVGRSVYEQLHG